jgi:hypothetical protein
MRKLIFVTLPSFGGSLPQKMKLFTTGTADQPTQQSHKLYNCNVINQELIKSGFDDPFNIILQADFNEINANFSGFRQRMF